MDITIGIQNINRELSVETEESSEDVAARVSEAIAKSQPTVEFEDVNGKRVIVPTSTLAYVEVGSEEPRRVGFGTS